MEYFFFIVLFFLAIPLGLFFVFKPVFNDKKIRNDVRNSDFSMKHYCFLLNCNQQEAINQLSIRNIYDSLECKLDTNNLTIVFSHLNSSIEHQLSFYVFEDQTYLKVSRVPSVYGRSNIPYKINKFFVEKIGAVPVDYSYFESTISPANH